MLRLLLLSLLKFLKLCVYSVWTLWWYWSVVFVWWVLVFRRLLLLGGEFLFLFYFAVMLCGRCWLFSSFFLSFWQFVVPFPSCMWFCFNWPLLLFLVLDLVYLLWSVGGVPYWLGLLLLWFLRGTSMDSLGLMILWLSAWCQYKSLCMGVVLQPSSPLPPVFVGIPRLVSNKWGRFFRYSYILHTE